MLVFEYRVYQTLQVPVHRLYTPLDTLATLYDDIFALSWYAVTLVVLYFHTLLYPL
jgi:hypothetical protein